MFAGSIRPWPFRAAACLAILVGMVQALASGLGRLSDLLAAVEQGKVNVTTLPLTDLVRDAFAGLRADTPNDADAAARLIGAGTRLVELKSAALLPPVASPASTAEDEAPAEDLDELLRACRQFKVVAEALREREEQGMRSFPRLVPAPVPPAGTGLERVTLDRLAAIVQEALRRRPADPPAIQRETVTVRERIRTLEAALARDGWISFHTFIASCRTRLDVIVGFMAVLELIKRGAAAAEQPEPFGDILIVARAPVGAAAD